MSNIDKQALRDIAEKAKIAGEAPVMPFEQRINALNDFMKHFTPATALALLDELEAKDAQIANLTAERDALREGEMGDAKHSNTRAAADIYFQLVEECEVPAGGSLVEYVSELRERAAMLQGAEPVTTAYKLPEGWVAVPVEPTEDMIVNGFESEPDESFSDADVCEAYESMSGCQQAAHRAKLCWAAMIAAAPKPEVK
ncbi:ead/Ea22-like family protein [Enterobacter hormaechei]|uniref:ead/Ea22-like family protein n=1 Tax=Enterobacter hormaechei TaxID=158836 RepID=UPI000B8C770D|nr:ead/Ea22-like family protein [Enterobacter hormaechei]OXU37254.1 hypothetical protein BME81_05930 [Enterobacter hormaechei subsp. steigerwaltii]